MNQMLVDLKSHQIKASKTSIKFNHNPKNQLSFKEHMILRNTTNYQFKAK